MVYIIVQLIKVLLIIFFALFTFSCFNHLNSRNNVSSVVTGIVLFIFHGTANVALYLETKDFTIILSYVAQIALLVTCWFVFTKLYKNVNRVLIQMIQMFLSIGFIMLTRLSATKSYRQIAYCFIALFICCFIPLIMNKTKNLRRYTLSFAIIGIGLLGLVLVLGVVSYGANLSLSLGPITIQPSEFVKITYVLAVAGMFYKQPKFRTLVITAAIAAIHVLILVVSTDLGGALIYYVTFLIMLYVATRKPMYIFIGSSAGILAAMLAYKLFSHVRIRVLAWKDPFLVIDDAGYQVTQSLFSIGTGGWFGLGLNEGTPNAIPVVTKDFIYAAISEEMGGIIALCLVLLCLCCFMLMINEALQLKHQYTKLIALGFGCTYILQVFLNVGGVIKFIPSTGVTLPLISYGGSSLVSTIVMFSILFILPTVDHQEKEVIANERAQIKATK